MIEVLFGQAMRTKLVWERERMARFEATTGQQSVLSHAEPTGLFTGFGESSLDFQLPIWVGDPDPWMSARSELNIRINRALAEAGITIPFPQRDLDIQSLPEAPVAAGEEAGM